MDPTGSGNGVTETDASTIVNTLISTDLYLEDYLSRHFTNFLQGKFNLGMNSRSTRTNTNETPTQHVPIVNIEGGSIITNDQGQQEWVQ